MAPWRALSGVAMDRAAVNENRPVDDHRLAVAEAASKYA